MFRVRIFLGVLTSLCLTHSARADDDVPHLVTAQGTIEKVDRDALTLRLRESDGKTARNLLLKVTSASRLTALSRQKRASEIVIGQNELRPEDLKPRQGMSVIYTADSGDNILLTAVVQPDAERDPSSTSGLEVPPKVVKVLKYIDEHKTAPSGYEGGRTFLNLGRDGEQALPRRDARGRPITYHEWDVNPRVPGKNRGPERLVTGSDGSAYYTADHYRTYRKIR